MTYDVVIATKDRPGALKLSIPLILNQNLPPEKLVIVDSSDDHPSICQIVKEIVNNGKSRLVIVHSRPNLPHQRNIGLKYVKSPIVMFSDDDSLWWQGVAQAILQIYQRDKQENISGVCATWATEPPPEANLSDGTKYRMKRTDRIKQKIGGWRHRLEHFICPNPMYVHGRLQWQNLSIPKWLSDENAVIIEYMNGLCMTYRTELIRKYGFDGDLGLYTGWAPNEDIAASFAVMQERPLVRACCARVCHYTFPSLRGKGFKIGFTNQFNRAYVLCRYSPLGSSARKSLRRFAVYKMLQYTLGIHSKFGRERLRGHLRAMSLTKKLLNTPLEDLRESYLDICQEALGHSRT